MIIKMNSPKWSIKSLIVTHSDQGTLDQTTNSDLEEYCKTNNMRLYEISSKEVERIQAVVAG